MIYLIAGLKQDTLQMNCHALFHFDWLHRAAIYLKQIIQNEITCLHRESNLRPLAFQACATLIVNYLGIE